MNDNARLKESALKRSPAGRLTGKLMFGTLIVALGILIGGIATVLYAKNAPPIAAGRAEIQEKEQAPQQTMPSEDKETSVPQPKKPFGYIILNKRLSNLQLDDVTQPVYDRRTSEERMARQLPLELPSIPLYTEKKVAYLTFDDGPDCVNTPKILDILEQYEVPATFYVLGCRAEQNPDVLQRIFREGHAVGNHSYDHDYSTLYGSPNDFLWQIIHTEEIIRNILGVRPLIVRAPGGASGNFTEDFWQAMKNYGYVEHDWNVCTNDATAESPKAERQIEYVNKQTDRALKDDAAIILMHCTEDKEETVKALPKIIEMLKEKGYIFGVVSPMTPQPY